MAWRASPDGSFSVSSAYSHIADRSSSPKWLLFDLIWSWKGPYRVLFLLWRMVSIGLPTNEQRDCSWARQFCSLLLGIDDSHPFFFADLHQWVMANLQDNQFTGRGRDCPLLFGLTVEVIWRQRNLLIF
ncbi:unnamed protein product [Lupinus luteus]|uniref:Reverse transcriptase zinc-binding domain-containing protein n=1 Tax=Lupinus luteus TaxID=3873 RepID=A0AAV1VXJ9_LUPLU